MSRLRPLIDGLGFAEAPRWHDGHLWFVDFFAGTVVRSTLAGEQQVEASVPGMPSGLGFLPDGTPLVVSQRDFQVLRIGADGALSTYADLSALARGAANEMLVDGTGRAWVGHHGFDFFGGAPPQPSSLLLVRPDGRVTEAADDLIFPNGTVLTDGGRSLVVAESFANRLTAFDVAPDGGLSNRRIWADLGAHTPDGICLDSEGAIWAASPMTCAFVRVAEGGAILDTIETGDRWAVACAFVGDDLATLACVTAQTSVETMARGESAAFISVTDVSVPGARL